MEKKINIKNDFNVLKDLIIRVFVFICILYIMNLSLWIIFILLASGPSIYLHLKYSLQDENKTLIVEHKNISLKINNKNFSLNSTEKIIIHGSVGLTRNIIPIFISPSYYYITFISKEFGELTISSLVDLNLNELILERFDKNIISYDYFILY